MSILSQDLRYFSREYEYENLFALAIAQKQTTTRITMQMLNEYVTTGHIPFITELLKLHLPNVLLTQCFNEENLPFKIEVKNTELGHLFEHILLEYLCQLKIAKGHNRASFAGRTRWNWIKDPKGKFHIHLNCGAKDADILPEAVEKTIDLMKIILQYNQTPLFAQKKMFSSKNGLKNGKKLKRKVTITPKTLTLKF